MLQWWMMNLLSIDQINVQDTGEDWGHRGRLGTQDFFGGVVLHME